MLQLDPLDISSLLPSSYIPTSVLAVHAEAVVVFLDPL